MKVVSASPYKDSRLPKTVPDASVIYKQSEDINTCIPYYKRICSPVEHIKSRCYEYKNKTAYFVVGYIFFWGTQWRSWLR